MLILTYFGWFEFGLGILIPGSSLTFPKFWLSERLLGRQPKLSIIWLTGSISGTNGITISELLEKPNLTSDLSSLANTSGNASEFWKIIKSLKTNYPVSLPPKLCFENEIITIKLNWCEVFNHCFISSGYMFTKHCCSPLALHLQVLNHNQINVLLYR